MLTERPKSCTGRWGIRCWFACDNGNRFSRIYRCFRVNPLNFSSGRFEGLETVRRWESNSSKRTVRLRSPFRGCFSCRILLSVYTADDTRLPMEGCGVSVERPRSQPAWNFTPSVLGMYKAQPWGGVGCEAAVLRSPVLAKSLTPSVRFSSFAQTFR